jgi:hypothetical protein
MDWLSLPGHTSKQAKVTWHRNSNQIDSPKKVGAPMNTVINVIEFILGWPFIVPSSYVRGVSEGLWLLLILGIPTVIYYWRRRHEMKLAWIQNRRSRADRRHQEKIRRAQEGIRQARERKRKARN